VLLAVELKQPEVLRQRIARQQVGVVPDDLDRLVELCPVRDDPGGADIGDRQLAQLLLVLGQRLVQLVQAAGAERDVRRPAGGVERAAGGGDDASGAWSSTWPVAGLTDG